MDQGGLRVSRFSVSANALHRLVVCITANTHSLPQLRITLRACIHCPHTLPCAYPRPERTSMSFVALPPSCAWLQTANSESVRWEHFIQCVVDYAAWLRASGMDAIHIYEPAQWVNPGDLQSYSDVVSWWPADAPASHAAPSLFTLLQHLRIAEGSAGETFNQALQWHVARVRAWLAANRRDPENPNESKAERDARLNRERVARHRLRHMAGSDDPEEHALIERAKTAEANASAGRKWLKGTIQQEKLQCTTDIAARKLHRDNTIAAYTQAVADAEKQAMDAKTVLDQYRANK